MNTVIAIYSHASRKQVRDATIADLRHVGLEPEVITIQDAPPSQTANRRNAHDALVKAYDGNPILMLEDDVKPNAHLRAWIEWLEANASTVTTLYACVGKFYTPDVRPFVEAGTLPPRHLHGLYELQGLRGWYGAQAVWIPTQQVEAMIHDKLFRIHEHAPYGPWDHAIRSHLQAHQQQMHVVVPNVIQHRAPQSVVNRTGPRHTTPIFSVAEIPPKGES